MLERIDRSGEFSPGITQAQVSVSDSTKGKLGLGALVQRIKQRLVIGLVNPFASEGEDTGGVSYNRGEDAIHFEFHDDSVGVNIDLK